MVVATFGVYLPAALVVRGRRRRSRAVGRLLTLGRGAAVGLGARFSAPVAGHRRDASSDTLTACIVPRRGFIWTVPERPSTGVHFAGGGRFTSGVEGRAAVARPIDEALDAWRGRRASDPGGGDARAAAAPESTPTATPARSGDVDGWGRSEQMRAIARQLYDPVYKHWFRAEWEGLEHIPREGGALLVANHGGAIPSDAPVIMHGIETELGRPVYGLAENLFRSLPVIGTLWSRTGGVPAHPDNAYRLLHDEQQLALVFPEGTKATGKLVPRPLQAAPLRARRLRRDRDARRRARSCRSRSSATRRRCRSSARAAASPSC